MGLSHARLGWAGCRLALLLLWSALRRSSPDSCDQQLPLHLHGLHVRRVIPAELPCASQQIHVFRY